MALPTAKSPSKSPSQLPTGIMLSNWEKGASLINQIGYGILIFSAIDYAVILIPFRITNPAWELEAIKQLINQVIVLLVGLVFVFYRPMNINRKLTKFVLAAFSWLCLLLGVLYLLMLPLAMINVGRVTLIQQNNINARLSQELGVFDEQAKRVSRPGITERELQGWAQIARLTPERLARDKAANISLQQSILNQFKTGREATTIRTQQNLSSLQKQSIKETISVILRGMIASVSLVWIWFSTRWARKSLKKSRRRKSRSQTPLPAEQNAPEDTELDAEDVS
ncbi:MAG: HpsJ family protein [Pseudanabaenaceae cyanobacterium bins.68]|nr:HpsJ family protein [Pseudanabaenaceae cyanobacterium bins.68]